MGEYYKMNEAPKILPKKKGRTIIKETTFKFDGEKIKNNLVYQGKGGSNQPDKRYDENCEGLCLFIYPSLNKVWYAYKYREMFNHKKGRLEKNCFYKRMFKYQDVKGYKYRDAKDKLKEHLDKIKAPTPKRNAQRTFGDLAKQFLKEGMDGQRQKKFAGLAYKKSTKYRYTQYTKCYLLLKSKSRSLVKKLTQQIIYKNKLSTRPMKDYLLSEIGLWHVEVLRERLKDTPPTADAICGMISIIYTWAIEQDVFDGKNPCDRLIWRKGEPIKSKLIDSDITKMEDYFMGKAFDYDPHFLCCLGLHMETGQRSTDIFGLRWEAPNSVEEKENCSGWLLENWETAEKPKIYLWNMKNRENRNVHIDGKSLELLKRLKEANLRDRNSWALKSPYIFPQKWDQSKHATYSSYQGKIKKLNATLKIEKLEGDNIPRYKGKTKVFTMKVSRKTLGTQIARKYGEYIASKKLGHSTPAVTRRNYIVPDAAELEIENPLNTIPNEDLIVVRKDKKSPWFDKKLIEKKE
tara:strand:- start:238 stop:1794 length:1557 start_codon:yes stop_codon:yes gene_type:complete